PRPQAGLIAGSVFNARGDAGQHVWLRLRQHEVECNNSGSEIEQLVDEPRQDVTAPGPCTDRGERALVDVDNANWVARIDLARLQLLQGIERHQPKPGEGLRIDPSTCRGGAKAEKTHEPVHATGTQDAPSGKDARPSSSPVRANACMLALLTANNLNPSGG